MGTLPPLYPQVSTLWAPSLLYEAGNSRQRKPLGLYDGQRPQSSKAEKQLQQTRQARYGSRRDLAIALRGVSTRMIWDYQAEAATLDEEEQEYETQLESIRTHGFSWMVPEGKQMNQEAEADDDAVIEEARATAAAATVQGQPPSGHAATSTEGGDITADQTGQAASTRRRTAGRRGRQRGRRRSGTGPETRSTRAGPRSSGNSTSGVQPPSSRDRGTNAPPRASAGRYSISSSNGGNAVSVPLPRYGVPSNTSIVSRSGRYSGDAIADNDERDLDADIPDADESTWENEEEEDAADAVQHLDEDDDIFTDPGEGSSGSTGYARDRRGRRRSAQYEATTPRMSDAEADENQENEDSTDMDVSN